MKKLFYVIPIASILLFSCAGTPKNSGNQTLESVSEQTDSQTAPNDEAYSERNDNLSVSENTVETAENNPAQENTIDADTEKESEAETDYIDETEPLSEMETPDELEEKLNAADIDELQELDNQYAEEESSDSDAEEPLVRDIALEEDSKLPETDSDAPAENISSADTDDIPSEENSNKDENVSLPETDAQLSPRTNETENETAALQNAQNASDTNADESPENNNSADESANKIHPAPSRTMTAKKNQLIEAEYPGRGWIYQGNIDEEGNIDTKQKNFVFGGRKLGAENQTFSIRARNPGKYLLHFYKNDALTGTYIDDYLEVNVENEEVPLTSRIKAPDYAKAVPPAVKITSENTNADNENQPAIDKTEMPETEEIPAKQTNVQNQSIPPVEQKISEITRASVQNTNAGPEKTIITEQENISQGRQIPETSDDSQRHYYINSGNTAENSTQNRTGQQNSSTDIEASDESSSSVMEIPQTGIISEEEKAAEELLTLAKKQYEAKEYEKALETLKQFFAQAVLKIDEGLFLQGNILESKSNVRNIKNAIDSYDLIVRDYPASSLWDRANKRSIYLKRFYINIR
ncbi:MAG: hypothetical protein ACTTJ1_05155 [Treponema sp.]